MRLIERTKAAAGPVVYVTSGVFWAHMLVDIQNDGPITPVLQAHA